VLRDPLEYLQRQLQLHLHRPEIDFAHTSNTGCEDGWTFEDGSDGNTGKEGDGNDRLGDFIVS